MNFKKFYDNLIRETTEVFESSPKTSEIQDKILNAWVTYKIIESNKALIWATWFLAISAIVLSGLTLYLDYLV